MTGYVMYTIYITIWYTYIVKVTLYETEVVGCVQVVGLQTINLTDIFIFHYPTMPNEHLQFITDPPNP